LGETWPRSRHRRGMNQPHSLTTAESVMSWSLQLIVAGILLQTLFFKFTGAEESVYIFSTLGIEPWGRIGSGIAELAAAVLLLVPATVVIGAVLSAGVISGAIVSHLTVLGIEVQGDGGLLFALAVVVFVLSLAILLIRRSQIPMIGRLAWSL
jgi:putative oxidoreductase